MKYPWLDEYLMKKSGVTKNTENWGDNGTVLSSPFYLCRGHTETIHFSLFTKKDGVIPRLFCIAFRRA